MAIRNIYLGGTNWQYNESNLKSADLNDTFSAFHFFEVLAMQSGSTSTSNGGIKYHITDQTLIEAYTNSGATSKAYAYWFPTYKMESPYQKITAVIKEHTFASSSGDGKIWFGFNYSDPSGDWPYNSNSSSNYVCVLIKDNGYTLLKNNAGGYLHYASTTYSITDGDKITLEWNSTSSILYINGSSVLTVSQTPSVLLKPYFGVSDSTTDGSASVDLKLKSFLVEQVV